MHTYFSLAEYYKTFQFHNTSNTRRLLPTPVGLLVLPCTSQVRLSSSTPPLLHPPFFPYPGQKNQLRPVPVPVTGVHYTSLLSPYLIPDMHRQHKCNKIFPFLTCTDCIYYKNIKVMMGLTMKLVQFRSENLYFF